MYNLRRIYGDFLCLYMISVHLALLELKTPITPNGGKAGLVKIYERPIDTIVGESITISGWGITMDYGEGRGNEYTNDLLVSTVKHAETEFGEKLVLTDTEGNVSCGGDSGGKKLNNMSRNYHQLWHVTSCNE